MTKAAAGHSADSWRSLVAVGLVAGELTSVAIARYGGVAPAEAVDALDRARAAGVIDDDGAIVEPETAEELVAALSAPRRAEVHAAAARHLFVSEPDRLVEAIEHARAAGALAFSPDLVTLADTGGQVKLSVGDYDAARRLFELAIDLDATSDGATRGRRLLGLATALKNLGRIDEARETLTLVAQLAEIAGDASLLTSAAVTYAVPPTFDVGDHRAAALLQQADGGDLTVDDRIMVNAARGWVEMRILVGEDKEHTLTWVSRPEIGQPLTEKARRESEGRSDSARALAAVAWRATHRGPSHLPERLEMSTEALQLSQRLRLPVLQVEAALLLAIDGLEAGDRALFDRSVATAQWVAERDGNPRSRWRALTLATGAAFLSGDIDGAERLAAAAKDLGTRHRLPVWWGAFAYTQWILIALRDDPVELRSVLSPELEASLNNQDLLASMAFAYARVGDLESASRLARRALTQLDHEMSVLVTGTRLADAAVMVGDADLRRQVIDLLSPWAAHVAADGNGWWSDGPVALRLAELHAAEDDDATARRYADQGVAIARSVDDRRSLQRGLGLLDRLGRAPVVTAALPLSPRQIQVARLVAEGRTNSEIARQLNYSLSTVKADLAATLRELGLANRAQLASRAAGLGLVGADDT